MGHRITPELEQAILNTPGVIVYGAKPLTPPEPADEKPMTTSVDIDGAVQVVWIAHWHPSPLNKLLHGHWSNGNRLKKIDRAIIHATLRLHRHHAAQGPRRLDIHVMLRKGQRACDRDAYWKSTKDALVLCGALKDDTRRLCIDGQVTFSRGFETWGTMLILTEAQT